MNYSDNEASTSGSSSSAEDSVLGQDFIDIDNDDMPDVAVDPQPAANHRGLEHDGQCLRLSCSPLHVNAWLAMWPISSFALIADVCCPK